MESQKGNYVSVSARYCHKAESGQVGKEGSQGKRRSKAVKRKLGPDKQGLNCHV